MYKPLVIAITFVGIILLIVFGCVKYTMHHEMEIGQSNKKLKESWELVSSDTTYFKYMNTVAMRRITNRYVRVVK